MNTVLRGMRLVGFALGLLATVARAQPVPGGPQPTSAVCGGVLVPAWVTSGRPSTPSDGRTGYNSMTGYCESYIGGLWSPAISGATGPSSFSASMLIGGASQTNTDPYQFQISITADPSKIPASPGYARDNILITTLNYSGTTTNIWEGLSVFTSINGPGVAEGEINGIYSNQSVAPGATVEVGETYEAKFQNNGTVIGGWNVYLALAVNLASGDSSAGTLTGYNALLTNNNTTVGSVLNFTAYHVTAMAGGGSAPTFYWAFRNEDPLAMISSNGPAIFGSSGTASASQLVTIQCANNSGGTFPLVSKNLAGTNLLYVTCAGNGVLGGSTFDINGNLGQVASVGNGSTALEISGAGSWSANGAVATTMTSLGPTGSHTTIQEWLTVKDSAGTVRYVPSY